MARLRDQLPQRLSDPLHNVRNHVARRTGMVDPVREKRKRREQERQPRVEPGLPRELIDLVGHDHDADYAPLAHSHTATMTVRNSAVIAAAGNSNGTTLACNAGETCTGGGVFHNGAHALCHTTYSAPSGNGWTAFVQNNTGGNVTVTVYALCQENPVT